jgi:hypothetical protein
MKEISSREYEKALDKERDALADKLEVVKVEVKGISADYFISEEEFDKAWEGFVSELDDILIDNFTLERDPEDT